MERAWEAHFNRPDVDFSRLRDVLEPTRDGVLDNTEECVRILGELPEACRAAGLPSGFPEVYYRLSDLILRACRDDTSAEHTYRGMPLPYFENPAQVTRSQRFFFETYAVNVRNIVDAYYGDADALQRVIPPWRLAKDFTAERERKGLQFLLGMQTHITARDLRWTLFASEAKQDYYNDYSKTIQLYIAATTAVLAPDLIEAHPTIQKALQWPTVRYIGSIREAAWKGGMLLQSMRDPHERETYLRYVDSQAAELVRYTRLLCAPALGLLSLTSLQNQNGPNHNDNCT